MVERPEVAIQAILAGIRYMQQLNMQLADRLAMVGLGGPGQAVERDNLGRTRSEAGRTTSDSPKTDPPLRGGGTAGTTLPSGSKGPYGTTG